MTTDEIERAVLSVLNGNGLFASQVVDAVQMKADTPEGTIYATLYRVAEKGLAAWVETKEPRRGAPKGTKRRAYYLTPEGQQWVRENIKKGEKAK